MVWPGSKLQLTHRLILIRIGDQGGSEGEYGVDGL
jgi:hypothetical protein